MMRPVHKMEVPVPGNFDHHDHARGELERRLGRYCSYCERAVFSSLAVEHIQPRKHHPKAVADTWANYLLACSNCNSCKLATDVNPSSVLLPDRDNTIKAFDLAPDGSLLVNPQLNPQVTALAQATLDLFRLGTRVRDVKDLNGNLVENDRIDDRMDMLTQASLARTTWSENPTPAQMASIVKSAKNSGFFSMWMLAFNDVPEIRAEFIKEFTGTSRDCFDLLTTLPIAMNRPSVPGLVASGKL